MERKGEAFICLSCMSNDSLSTSGAATPSFSLAQLPPFCVICLSHPVCGVINGKYTDYVQQVSLAYDAAVHWRCSYVICFL